MEVGQQMWWHEHVPAVPEPELELFPGAVVAAARISPASPASGPERLGFGPVPAWGLPVLSPSSVSSGSPDPSRRMTMTVRDDVEKGDHVPGRECGPCFVC